MMMLMIASVILLLVAAVLGGCQGASVLATWYRNECKGSIEEKLAERGFIPCLVLVVVATCVSIGWLLVMSFSTVVWIVAYLLPPIMFFIYWLYSLSEGGVQLDWTYVVKVILGLVFWWPVVLIYGLIAIVQCLVLSLVLFIEGLDRRTRG